MTVYTIWAILVALILVYSVLVASFNYYEYRRFNSMAYAPHPDPTGMDSWAGWACAAIFAAELLIK